MRSWPISNQSRRWPAGKRKRTAADDRLTGWSDIRLRISRHLTPQSALFRHAIRMSVVLCVGYAFIQFTGMQHGYWILLTSLFVCQPNYNATRRRGIAHHRYPPVFLSACQSSISCLHWKVSWC